MKIFIFMSSIKLFYTYLYVNKNTKVVIKNNKIYDDQKKFICGLLNIPNNNKYFKVLIERNLLKPKQSKKNFITSFEKNNMKIFIDFDINKIVNSIKSNTFSLKDKYFFFNMLKTKFIKYLDPNDLVFDKICLINNEKKIDAFIDNLKYENPEAINISSTIFDLKNHKIIKNNLLTLCDINGHLIYTDSIKDSIYTIIEKMHRDKKKLYIIFTEDIENNYWDYYLKNYQKKIVSLKIINYSQYNIKTYKINNKKIVLMENCSLNSVKNSLNEFDSIIFENTKIHESLKCIHPNKTYLSNNINETVMCFCNKINKLFNKDIDYKKININTLYSLSKLLIKHDFFTYYKNNGDLIFENLNSYNFSLENTNSLYNYSLVNKEKKQEIFNNLENNKCCICLENIKFDNLVITNCNHYYCKKCITNSVQYSRKCCICRSNVKNLTIPVLNKNELFEKNKWFYVGESINKIYDKIKTNVSVIIYTENNYLYNYLKNILVFTTDNVYTNYKLFNNINNLINTITNNRLNINKDKVYLFIINSKSNAYNSVNLTMCLKNIFKKVYFTNLNINNNFSNVIT